MIIRCLQCTYPLQLRLRVYTLQTSSNLSIDMHRIHHVTMIQDNSTYVTYIYCMLGHNIQLPSCPYTAIETSEEVMASYIKLVTSLQEDTPVMLEDLERVCSITQKIHTAKSKMPKRLYGNDLLRE